MEFESSANIIKYKKINGQQILEATEDFLRDTLGINKLDELQKIRFEVGRRREGSIGSLSLYGWGSNSFG